MKVTCKTGKLLGRNQTNKWPRKCMNSRNTLWLQWDSKITKMQGDKTHSQSASLFSKVQLPLITFVSKMDQNMENSNPPSHTRTNKMCFSKSLSLKKANACFPFSAEEQLLCSVLPLLHPHEKLVKCKCPPSMYFQKCMTDTICRATIKGADNKRYFHLENVYVLWDYLSFLHIRFTFHAADNLVSPAVLPGTPPV